MTANIQDGKHLTCSHAPNSWPHPVCCITLYRPLKQKTCVDTLCFLLSDFVLFSFCQKICIKIAFSLLSLSSLLILTHKLSNTCILQNSISIWCLLTWLQLHYHTHVHTNINLLISRMDWSPHCSGPEVNWPHQLINTANDRPQTKEDSLPLSMIWVQLLTLDSLMSRLIGINKPS